MIGLILKWAVPFVCGFTVSFITAGVMKYRSVKNGLTCLLRAEIIRSYDKYTERGKIPIYAKEALAKEYNAYHNLGGNDVATDLYMQLNELQTY